MAEPGPDELMRDIASLRRVVGRRVRAGQPSAPLPPSQVEVLRFVEECPGTGVSAAARALHLADNTVSGLVNQLVDAGLLDRTTRADDRRAVRLHLTRAALARLRAWRSARSDVVAAGLARLSAADRLAIARALPALRRLTDEIVKEER